jgi:hypothetical protein
MKKISNEYVTDMLDKI